MESEFFWGACPRCGARNKVFYATLSCKCQNCQKELPPTAYKAWVSPEERQRGEARRPVVGLGALFG